jgi:hypothetical protein
VHAHGGADDGVGLGVAGRGGHGQA